MVFSIIFGGLFGNTRYCFPAAGAPPPRQHHRLSSSFCPFEVAAAAANKEKNIGRLSPRGNRSGGGAGRENVEGMCSSGPGRWTTALHHWADGGRTAVIPAEAAAVEEELLGIRLVHFVFVCLTKNNSLLDFPNHGGRRQQPHALTRVLLLSASSTGSSSCSHP